MLLKIRHGLLEITNIPNNKKSAIIINDEIILTSGCILQPYIKPMANNEQCISSILLKKLQNGDLIDTQQSNSDESKLLNSLHYQITFDQRSLMTRAQILTRYGARVLYVFSCAEISKYIRQIFVSEAEISAEECLLSTFVVLSFKNLKNEKQTFKRFIAHMRNYLRFLYSVKKLDDVLTICTPFGLESFYKTVNIGKVSNLVSQNGCLFVLSNSLPMGCEGAAVFNDKLRIIGMIICTTFQRQNENVNLTLAASFSYLLTDILKKLGITVSPIIVPKNVSNFKWERSIAVVKVNNNQGTGTLVKICNKNFILTCSHVVFNSDSQIICRNADGNFEADLVWKNPNFNQPFDVALLKPRTTIPNKYFLKLSTLRPHPGQMVYNAGFPFFINFYIKNDFNPSIFQGRIIKCAPGAIISDGSVQAGQSGGPMFDENGCVIGICVSNMKMDDIIYPNCNTAVPICDIRQTLEEYAKTEDLAVLNNLVANDIMQQAWNLTSPPIQSKL